MVRENFVGDEYARTIAIMKALAADAVEARGNGHPGTAVSLAPAAYLLYQKCMRYNPLNPTWYGRDRFILSIGHSSLTQYIQLMFAGFGLEIDDIKDYRKHYSLTPGHPEYGLTNGVEMTTGPLGAGLASAVGFAMASRYEHGLFDPETPIGRSIFDHNVYVLAGDGDLQEGITHEACSFAGTQQLGNLIVIYDDNHITIEGDTKLAFTEDVIERFDSYGWHTERVKWLQDDGSYVEDVDALAIAIAKAQNERERPSLISLRSLMAWPTPEKTDSGSAHGNPLGEASVRGLKEVLGLDPEVDFYVDQTILNNCRQAALKRGAELEEAWEAKFAVWAAENPERAQLFERLRKGELPANLAAVLPKFESGAELPTRVSSNLVINSLAQQLPELWGGSADLGSSNGTTIKGGESFLPMPSVTDQWPGNEYGRIIHFGIREHAMAAILNGIVLGGVTRAFGGTFFVFSDYMRGSVRLAAIMGAPSIFVWTHDSIGVGEDGLTHQPVEHLAAMRAIPGLDVVRPADANEVAQCWLEILSRRDRPAGLVLSRQNVPTFPRGKYGYAEAELARKGGYIFLDPEDHQPDVILIATGSEVQFAEKACKELAGAGVKVRVVSMPCVEWFEEQSNEYKEHVLPKSVKARVSIEAGISQPWYKYLGEFGIPISVEHYGQSATADELYFFFGIFAKNIMVAAIDSIEKVADSYR
jgi:transketolase